jgi:hypothetical protein
VTTKVQLESQSNFAPWRLTMTLNHDQQQQNLDYHFHPPRHRVWHIAVFFVAIIFVLMAGYVVLSDPAPKAIGIGSSKAP